MSAPRTPIAEALRGFAAPYAATGNSERAAGLVQAADYVDEQAHLLTGKALVEAMVAMIGAQLEEFVADVVAALRTGEAGAAGPAGKPRPKRAPLPPPSVPLVDPKTMRADLDRALRTSRGIIVESASWDTRPDANWRADGLNPGARKILAALVQHFPDPVTRSQLAVIVGYKKTARDTYCSRLAGLGYLARAGKDYVATAAGVAAAGDVARLPTGRALLSHYLGTLAPGERRILEYVASFYPHPIARERIGQELGYKKTARDTYLSRLRARKLIEDPGRGHVGASAHLFDAPHSRAGGAR